MADQILDTASPFWLRLYGRWTHLQGIMPVVSQTSQRAFSELTTVDGYRYVQRAPRGPRTWEVEYRYGTGAATAALEAAAYDNNFSDPLTRTLFMDRNQARVNMVDPDLQTYWATSWQGNITEPASILNTGGEYPVWLPTYDMGDQKATLPEPYTRRSTYSLIPGETYTASVWTRASAGAVVLQVNNRPYTGAETSLGTGTTIGGGTTTDPELVMVTFTAPAGVGDMVEVEMSWAPFNAGLMVFEGDCPPDHYRNGRRMPCAVSVQDPDLTNNIIWSANCDPCDLPREHTKWTIQEVGTGRAIPENVVPVSEGSVL